MWATHQSLENLKHKALGMFFALPSKNLSSPLSRISDQYNQNIEHISTSQLIWTQFCVFSQSFIYVHTQRYRLVYFTEGLSIRCSILSHCIDYSTGETRDLQLSIPSVIYLYFYFYIPINNFISPEALDSFLSWTTLIQRELYKNLMEESLILV